MGADVLVHMIGHVDRRRRALGTIQALAGPAADADFTKQVAPFQVDGVGIHKLIGIAQFATKADRQETVRHAGPYARLAHGTGGWQPESFPIANPKRTRSTK